MLVIFVAYLGRNTTQITESHVWSQSSGSSQITNNNKFFFKGYDSSTNISVHILCGSIFQLCMTNKHKHK